MWSILAISESISHLSIQIGDQKPVLVSDVPEVMSAGGLTPRALTQLLVLLLQY